MHSLQKVSAAIAELKEEFDERFASTVNDTIKRMVGQEETTSQLKAELAELKARHAADMAEVRALLAERRLRATEETERTEVTKAGRPEDKSNASKPAGDQEREQIQPGTNNSNATQQSAGQRKTPVAAVLATLFIIAALAGASCGWWRQTQAAKEPEGGDGGGMVEMVDNPMPAAAAARTRQINGSNNSVRAIVPRAHQSVATNIVVEITTSADAVADAVADLAAIATAAGAGAGTAKMYSAQESGDSGEPAPRSESSNNDSTAIVYTIPWDDASSVAQHHQVVRTPNVLYAPFDPDAPEGVPGDVQRFPNPLYNSADGGNSTLNQQRAQIQEHGAAGTNRTSGVPTNDQMYAQPINATHAAGLASSTDIDTYTGYEAPAALNAVRPDHNNTYDRWGAQHVATSSAKVARAGTDAGATYGNAQQATLADRNHAYDQWGAQTASATDVLTASSVL